MLLGLYQITMSDETDHGNHDAHAHGLAALMGMGSGTSPLNLLSIGQPDNLSNTITDFEITKASDLFSVPALGELGGSLDNLLLGLNALWMMSEAAPATTELGALRNATIALYEHFSEWEISRATEFKPTTVGTTSPCPGKVEILVGYWPGNIDTYFDLYVAGVWNIYRSARLLLIALIIKLSGGVDARHDFMDYAWTINQTVNDMAASIPYHLTENLQVFVGQASRNGEITDPGKSLGGLLLMHPLYVASKMPFVPEKMREYLRQCLAWIGTNMGLGQATLLANARNCVVNHSRAIC